MNDRTPTTIERHPWLVLPAVLLAAVLTAFLRPVPASGEPVTHAAGAAPIVVLPGERPAVRCGAEAQRGPALRVVAVDATVRRAIVLTADATSGDVGRSAVTLARLVGRAAVDGGRTGHDARCRVPPLRLTGPVGLPAIGW